MATTTKSTPKAAEPKAATKKSKLPDFLAGVDLSTAERVREHVRGDGKRVITLAVSPSGE